MKMNITFLTELDVQLLRIIVARMHTVYQPHSVVMVYDYGDELKCDNCSFVSAVLHSCISSVSATAF